MCWYLIDLYTLPCLSCIHSVFFPTYPLAFEHAKSVMSVVSDSLRCYRLQPSRLPCPWDSPSKNTGVGCHALLQGVFLTQGSNPRLSFCIGRQVLYHQRYLGSPSRCLVSYLFCSPRQSRDHLALKISSSVCFPYFNKCQCQFYVKWFLAISIFILLPLLKLHSCPTCLTRRAYSSSSLSINPVMKHYQPGAVKVTTAS